MENVPGQAANVDIGVPDGDPVARTFHGAENLPCSEINVHDSAGQRIVGDVLDIVAVRDDPHLVLGDEDVLRRAEMRPLTQKFAVFLEDLNAVILAIADVDGIARIDGD